MPINPISPHDTGASNRTDAWSSSNSSADFQRAIANVPMPIHPISPHATGASMRTHASSRSGSSADFQGAIAEDSGESRDHLVGSARIERYGRRPPPPRKPNVLRRANRFGGNPEIIEALPKRIDGNYVVDPNTGSKELNKEERKRSEAGEAMAYLREEEGMSKPVAAMTLGLRALSKGHAPTKAGVEAAFSKKDAFTKKATKKTNWRSIVPFRGSQSDSAAGPSAQPVTREDFEAQMQLRREIRAARGWQDSSDDDSDKDRG
jgi:hypothetical protein